jgi:methylmalonyl-CoA mutase C-terminal domain/subunit
VDVPGLSSFAGAHMYFFPKAAEMLAEKWIDNVLLIGGVVIPQDDIPFLK